MGTARWQVLIAELLPRVIVPGAVDFRKNVAAFTDGAATDLPVGTAAIIVNSGGAFFSSDHVVTEVGHGREANGDFSGPAAGRANDADVERN